MTNEIFDRALLARRRDRVAGQAAASDFLLRRVADDLLERLALVRRTFPLVLDLGAHHGLLGPRLRAMRDVAIVVEADRSLPLLAQCAPPKVQADEELLPFRDGAFDLVISALALHFVNDLPGSLIQICRALKPDGLFMGALLGGATLTELRTAFFLAEDEVEGGASPRVAPFADVRDLGALLQRAGFALPVVDSDTVVATYPTALHLMRDLRAMGAGNVLSLRRRAPLKRKTLTRVCQVYADRFGRPDGRVPATFEILTMTGWAPQPRPR